MLKLDIFPRKIFLLSILFVNLQKVFIRLYKTTNKIFKTQNKNGKFKNNETNGTGGTALEGDCYAPQHCAGKPNGEAVEYLSDYCITFQHDAAGYILHSKTLQRDLIMERNDMNPFNWDEEQMKEFRAAFIAVPFLLVLYILIQIVC